MENYMAFDIGGTYMKHGIVNEQAEINDAGKVPTPKSMEDFLDTICKIIDGKSCSLAGVAVSAPGAVSEEGIIYGSSALPYIHGPNVKKLLEEKTGLPVFMENDANCAALAEVWKGAAKNMKDALLVVIGTGIGGAVIKNRKLHKGANLHGGEFGYMVVDTGENGYKTWSNTAATSSIIRRVAKTKGQKESELSGEQIFDLADQGDEICLKAIEEFYHMLAVGIYNLQYVYDPEVILIGGGVSARNDLIDHINEKLSIILSKVDIATVRPKIDVCHYRQHANLLGAVFGFLTNENIEF
ncbi:ROK family protein [Sediminibacillus massiliensis]|uniref:ROK family protein n=1 Tax=Sediminibacillus massiliensis TaxID=1926277 RepID=UPI00098864B9|nr:ROK family protein [Sediminibacillus massiliensis]